MLIAGKLAMHLVFIATFCPDAGILDEPSATPYLADNYS
jgi:hypothetical protein